MQIIKHIAELRKQCAAWSDQQLAFVPTMGNLHAGHLTLVEQASRAAEKLIVSIFVNPLQFGENEDFARYPQTLEQDIAALEPYPVDVLFVPDVSEIYPVAQSVQVIVPELEQLLCGRFRPGHFAGVATVLTKLFNIIQPDTVFLGKKDYQQWRVVEQLVQQLNFPLKIEGIATVRAADGLALSSRNQYLSPQQRALAPLLYQTLQQTAAAIRQGVRDYPVLTEQQVLQLTQAGFTVDYLTVCRQLDLQEATATDTQLVVLVAAWLGSARLLDNLEINL